MATTLRQALLPVVDKLRGIPAKLDLRRYTVSVVGRTWTGSRFGLGTNTDTETGLKVDLGIYQTKVTQVTQQDIIVSGNVYQEQDLKVGPITPPFSGTGANLDNAAISVWSPTPGAAPMELFFHIYGPDFPNGGWFKKISQDVSRNFRYDFVVRKTGEIP